MTTKSFESLVKNTHKTFKKEVGAVNFCEGCKQKWVKIIVICLMMFSVMKTVYSKMMKGSEERIL